MYKMLTKRAHKMKNSIKTSNIIKIKRESMTIVKCQTNIKICYINPRSVNNKILSLCDYIISNDFDLIALTETWLGKECISELLPPGYKIKHVPRPASKRGRSVSLSSSLALIFASYHLVEILILLPLNTWAVM